MPSWPPIDITRKGLSAALPAHRCGGQLQRMLKSGAREFKGFLSDLEKRLEVVENKTGLKGKAEEAEPPLPHPLRRRKVQGEGRAKGKRVGQSGVFQKAEVCFQPLGWHIH
jgi:hypothetical protein